LNIRAIVVLVLRKRSKFCGTVGRSTANPFSTSSYEKSAFFKKVSLGFSNV